MSGKNYFVCLLIGVAHFSALQAFQQSQAAGKDNYESLTGLKGTYNQNEQVFKASFPRDDVKISIDNLQLDPFMGLTSWVAFTPVDKNNFMIMGDLVLLQDEVNPVMSSLLNSNIEVTALHNHFFYDHPKIYFMHVGGRGVLSDLAVGIKKAMSIVKEIRVKNSAIPNAFEGVPISSSAVHPEPLEKIFGSKGQTKDGMVKFVFGRSVRMNNISIGNEMGVNTWAAFTGSNEKAIVDGDFAVHENELQSVLKVLRRGNINVVAIHHHMIMENPRMIFLHYWGKGDAENLAATIKEALAVTEKK